MEIDITQFDWFKDDGIFLPMINDGQRNIFYKNAIDRSVKDKVVCDIGSGTGLLSILSAKAGARKVFAIERDQGRYAYTKHIINKLGLQDKIEVIHDDFLNTDIKADIFVSETMNTQIFGEDILYLAEHARKQGGVFIPSTFEITPTIYKHHPIFILDQLKSDAWEFDPTIDVEQLYNETIEHDFKQRHPLLNTLYRANQLNKLFQLLPDFNDVKLTELWRGEPLIVDLNQPMDIEALRITIPYDEVSNSNNTDDWYMVFHWRAKFQDVVMDSNDVWFGNVGKLLHSPHDRKLDINTWYNPELRDWHVTW